MVANEAWYAGESSVGGAYPARGTVSAVSWSAVLAGAAAAAALSLILLLLGVGLGLAAVSPWGGDGASAGTLGAAGIAWLAFTQLAASGLGGYLAGRLRVRWRGTDPVMAQANWNWARAHLCGLQVKTLVDEMEKREKPFTDLGKRLVAVEIKAATATPAPSTYHVFWEETSTEYTAQRVKPYTGTFTVGRFEPPNQAVLMQNRLGLCITALNISEQP